MDERKSGGKDVKPTACGYALAVMVALVLGGCAHEGFPRVPLKPVTTFSLGSARAPMFETRPSAEQLYDAVLDLYDSFDSASATNEFVSTEVHQWSVVDGRAEDIKTRASKWHSEFRYVRPDKALVVHRGNIQSVMVRNGAEGLDYYPGDNTYDAITVRADRRYGRALTRIADWFELLPPQGRKIESMRLAPDAKVGDTDTYVLQYRLPYRRFNEGHQPPEVRSFYLGKRDLLLRRIEITWERMGSDRKVRGLPGGRTEIYDFSGFTANVDIPDALFSTEPPKGAKPHKWPGMKM